TSYTMVNTFLYSVYGQSGGTRNIDSAGIESYRNRWIEAIVAQAPIEAVVSLGTLAAEAVQQWRQHTWHGRRFSGPVVAMIHPTYPESASASGSITHAAAMARMLTNWNDALDMLRPVVTPDAPHDGSRYGTALAAADLGVIPEGDLP